MKQKQQRLILVLLCLLLVLLAGAAVLAQSSAGFNLEWHVIGSGGQESASANYRLDGTIGQGVAGPPLAGSAGFTVSSGYWMASTAVYLPVVLNN